MVRPLKAAHYTEVNQDRYWSRVHRVIGLVVLFALSQPVLADPPTVDEAIGTQNMVEDDSGRNFDLSDVFEDDDGDPLLFTVDSNSNPGLASVNIVGATLTLTPNPDQNGSATISIRATAQPPGAPESVVDTFTLNVSAVNDDPFVAGVVVNGVVTEDTSSVSVNLAGVFDDVDIAIEGDTLTYAVIGNTNTTLLSASAAGTTVLMNITPDQNGTATITVEARDSAGQTAQTAFNLDVTAVNDSPFVATPIADFTVAEDTTSASTSLAGVFDDVDIAIEGDTLTFSVQGNTNPALATANIASGQVDLVITPEASGQTTITVEAQDSAGAVTQTSFTLTVSPVNDPPFLVTPIAGRTINEDASALTVSLVGVFDDVDLLTEGDTLTPAAISNSNPTLATSVSFGATSVTVGFGADQNGSVSIAIEVTDKGGLTVQTTLTITVNPINDNPFVANPIGNLNLDEDDPLTSIVLLDGGPIAPGVFGDVDVATNGDSLSYVILNNDNPALFNSLAIVGGQLNIDLAPNAVGTANIVIEATDTFGATVQDSFSIDVTIVIPLAVDDSAFMDEDDGTITIDVLGNDDLGDEPTVIISVGRTWTDPISGITHNQISNTNPTAQFDETGQTFTDPNGALAIVGNQITYTAKDNYSGTDNFDYTIQDSDGDTSTGNVIVNINAVDDGPRAIGVPTYDVTQGSFIQVPVSGGLLDFAIDDDGDPLTVIVESVPSNAIDFYVNLDGSFRYVPDPTWGDDPGEELDTFEIHYRDDDDGLTSATVTVIINIDAVEPAVAGPPPGEVEFDFDLADVPLEDAVASEANVLVVMDDSGSMDWTYMTDQGSGLFWITNSGVKDSSVPSYTRYAFYLQNLSTNIYGNSRVLVTEEALAADTDFDDNDYGVWRGRNAAYSTTYYSPEIEYKPWIGLDRTGLDFVNADPANALLDPFDVTSQFIDLTATHDYTSNNVPVVHGSAADGRKDVLNDDVYYPYYYTTTVVGRPAFDDPHTKVEIVAGNAPFTGGAFRQDCAIDGDPLVCSFAREIQNFANWFTYYRSREYSAKSALGQAVTDASNVRMGYTVLNNNGVDSLQIETLNASNRVGHKKDLMDVVYRTRANGGTPLRQALDRAGRHFECVSGDSFGSTSNTNPGDAGCPVFAAPEGQCQNNFALLFSDGTWNSTFSGTGANNHDSDSPADPSISPFDGGIFADTTTASLADVAMYYYERDLHGLANGVPTTDRDIQGAPMSAFLAQGELMHQHMKTYTVGFGVTGNFTLADIPTDYTQSFSWGDPFSSGLSKIDDMLHAAVNGRGQFLQANNPVLLSAAFQDAFADFSDGSVSVSAVAFNSTALREETIEYRGFFNLKFNTGDLRALDVDPATGMVDVANPLWQAAEQLDTITPNNRVIVTFDNVGADGVPFRFGSLDPSQQAVLDNDQVEFIRGDRSNEEPNGILRLRPPTEGLLGDIVHSAPVFIGSPRAIRRDQEPYPTGTPELYSKYANDNVGRDRVVYVAANDGMLHGFDAGDPLDTTGTGVEVFGYVPNKLIDSNQRFNNELDQLTNLVYSHKFFVDLTPTIEDVYMPKDRSTVNKSWNTVLIGGLGGGGKGYYALNVSNPGGDFSNETNAANTVLWEFTDDDDTYPVDGAGLPLVDGGGLPLVDLSGFPVKDLGYTFSQPQIVMSNIDDGSGEQKWVSIFGNGYNSTAGIGKLFVLFMEEGLDGWSSNDFVKLDTNEGVRIVPDPLAGLPNGLGTPTIIDKDLNGTADLAYAGDLFGNLFRFDISDSNVANWTVTKLFQATYDETLATRQPITTKPLVLKHPTETGFVIVFGTGSYITEQDGTSTDLQSIYGIWDRDEVVPATDRSDAKSTRLVEQVLTNKVIESGFIFSRFRILSDNAVVYSPDLGATPGVYGWYIDFDPVRAATTDQGNVNPDATGQAPPAVQYAGERAVRRLVARGDNIIVASVLPRDANSCLRSPPGNIQGIDWLTGGNPQSAVFDFNGDGEVDENDLLNFAGTGYAGGIMLDSDDLDGTLVDPSILTGYGDTDFLFLSGGSEQLTIQISGVTDPKTGRLSWRELDDGI